MIHLLFALSPAHAQAVPFAGGSRDFHYRWVHTDGRVVEDVATFTFVPAAAQTAGNCNPAHARPYCWTGTFSTDDFGTGTVTSIALPGNASTRAQRITLTYDVTGAVYTGSVAYGSTTNRFTGTMVLTGNAAWAGTFDQNTAAVARSFAAAEVIELETGDTGIEDEAQDAHPGRGRGRPGWSGGPGGRHD